MITLSLANSLRRISPDVLLERAVLAAVLLAGVVAISPNVADPDLWGHVQYGRDWLAKGLPAALGRRDAVAISPLGAAVSRQPRAAVSSTRIRAVPIICPKRNVTFRKEYSAEARRGRRYRSAKSQAQWTTNRRTDAHD